jgi:hypothetical protein
LSDTYYKGINTWHIEFKNNIKAADKINKLGKFENVEIQTVEQVNGLLDAIQSTFPIFRDFYNVDPNDSTDSKLHTEEAKELNQLIGELKIWNRIGEIDSPEGQKAVPPLKRFVELCKKLNIFVHARDITAAVQVISTYYVSHPGSLNTSFPVYYSITNALRYLISTSALNPSDELRAFLKHTLTFDDFKDPQNQELLNSLAAFLDSIKGDLAEIGLL